MNVSARLYATNSQNYQESDYGHNLDLLANHLTQMTMCFISYEK